MGTQVQVIFYSMYGHVYQLAREIAAGVAEVADTEVQLLQVSELMPEEALAKSGADKIRSRFAEIPLATVAGLGEADALLFGTPTRFGNMCAQRRNFLDQTGGLWMKGGLVGKVASVFTSTGTQHGGQEPTITSFHTSLLLHGMLIVDVPYSEPRLMEMNEVTGGTPYGVSTLAGPDGARQPSKNELAIARFQGRHVAEIARQLKLGRFA